MNHLLAITEQSPLHVRAKNKMAWVALFGDNGVVQDPVGPAIHCGPVQLGKFWEAFIEPNLVTFDVKRDFVDEKSQRVVRIVDIHILMRDFDYKHGIIQPAHLIYDVIPEKNLVKSMQAHWEAARSRPRSLTWGGTLIDYLGSILATRHVMYNLGLFFTMKFSLSFLTAHFFRGKALLRAVRDAANARLSQGDMTAAEENFLALFERPHSPCVLQDGVLITAKVLWDRSISRSSLFMSVSPPFTAGGQTTMWIRRTDIDGGKWEGFMMIKVSRWFMGKISEAYWYEEMVLG